jgi:hypothetical protein
MFGWVKKAVKSVGKAIKGSLTSVAHVVKIVIHRIVGVIEIAGVYLNIDKQKKIRVEAVVLRKDRKPVAELEAVRDAIDLADKVFRKRMNVKIAHRKEAVVMLADDGVPAGNLSTPCGPKLGGHLFTAVSDWFRDNQSDSASGTLLGYGQPVTVFVIADVQGKFSGCSLGGMEDWVIIDPDAVRKSADPVDTEERLLTLAHEVAHACGLTHRDSHNLMRHASNGRTDHVTKWQKAWFRSSGHVTYR